MECYIKVVIIVFIMVMTTSCNPCFFATSSCDYSFRKNYPINSDDEYYVKNNTSKETRIADLRYCISYACPEVYQKYQLPDENGDYREIIRRKYKDDYKKGYKNADDVMTCYGKIGECMKNNKGYSTKW
ncbi:hypothetical protein ACKJPP_07445 [Neisseria polysaccharea]|uniref:hypothetical protein n=1 Tax=Neisseria polysaccharea TaxID=489 RepID=UPI0018FF7AC4